MGVTNNENHWQLMVLMLKDIAEQKNKTHQDIADDTGLHRSNVTRFFGLKYCPNLNTFLLVSRSLQVNFFFESQDSETDINRSFEKAMEQLERRLDKLSKN